MQISDPWLMHEVLAVANKHPEVIDKPRGFPLPIYDCFDRVRPTHGLSTPHTAKAAVDCAKLCCCMVGKMRLRLPAR